ncbi:MAG TPA: hypothetical protein VFS43_02215 [Polyangiaceae bacterium]|nr:hypothetical protein [Polyangiaceae bacterium]
MIQLPKPGLYRTTQPYPGLEDALPAPALVYVGQRPDDGLPFVVRPGQNFRNEWYWTEPTITLRSPTWAKTLVALPAEGFYTLPADFAPAENIRWPRNAIVQLGYNARGQGIVFLAERHANEERNVLSFSERGASVDDEFLRRLVRAPVLSVRPTPTPGDAPEPGPG